MGGFLLLEKDYNSQLIESSLQIFQAKKLKLNQTILTSKFKLFVFFKSSCKTENVYKLDEHNVIAATGTLIYKGKTNALKEVLRDFTENDCKLNFSLFLGHFCVIIIQNDKLFVFNDFGGIYHVYTNSSKTIFSSSFLAAKNLLSPKTLSKQELYEYIFYGATYGNKTIFNEIELLDCKKIWGISHKLQPFSISKTFGLNLNFNNRKFSTILESVSENLLNYFKIIKNNYNNDIIMGLSGGFDSRLILASLISNSISPKIYVSGNEKSSDVKISKLIAEKETLQFEHFNQDKAKILDKLEFGENIKNRFFNSDALNYAGIFSSTINMDISNSTKAMLNLNGGGGEIYRNFWTLPNKPISVRNFIKSKYDSIDFKVCTDEFNKNRFFKGFEEKIKLTLETNNEKINGKQVTMLYPFFRLRYWTGKGISILNQYSNALLPFSEPLLTFQSFEIPLKYKTAGYFEAELIKAINPRISKYQSNYGQSFFTEISYKNKFKDMAKIYTPISIRPFLRKSLKNQPANFPYFLSVDYLKELFDLNNLEVAKFVNISLIKDLQMFSRALTVEYLITK